MRRSWSSSILLVIARITRQVPLKFQQSGSSGYALSGQRGRDGDDGLGAGGGLGGQSGGGVTGGRGSNGRRSSRDLYIQQFNEMISRILTEPTKADEKNQQEASQSDATNSD